MRHIANLACTVLMSSSCLKPCDFVCLFAVLVIYTISLALVCLFIQLYSALLAVVFVVLPRHLISLLESIFSDLPFRCTMVLISSLLAKYLRELWLYPHWSCRCQNNVFSGMKAFQRELLNNHELTHMHTETHSARILPAFLTWHVVHCTYITVY